MKIRVLPKGEDRTSSYDVEYIEIEGRAIIQGGHYGDFKIIDPNLEDNETDAS